MKYSYAQFVFLHNVLKCFGNWDKEFTKAKNQSAMERTHFGDMKIKK